MTQGLYGGPGRLDWSTIFVPIVPVCGFGQERRKETGSSYVRKPKESCQETLALISRWRLSPSRQNPRRADEYSSGAWGLCKAPLHHRVAQAIRRDCEGLRDLGRGSQFHFPTSPDIEVGSRPCCLPVCSLRARAMAERALRVLRL